MTISHNLYWQRFALPLLLLVLTGCDSPAQEQRDNANPAAAHFIDSEGKSWSTSDWQGKWLIVNYWAIWCGPCREEIPELNRFDKRYNNIAKIVAINYDGIKGEALKKQSRELGIHFTVLADNVADYYQLPPSGVLPVTYLIDPQGKLSKTLVGPQTAAALADYISSRLNDG